MPGAVAHYVQHDHDWVIALHLALMRRAERQLTKIWEPQRVHDAKDR